MRIETKMLVMLLPLVLIAVFSVLSINAHSIDSTGSESADQLIDASNGISPYVVDTRFPTSPQESRRLQGLNNPDSAAPGSSASTQNSITQSEPAEPATENQNTTANSGNANETAFAEMTSTVEATTVSGNWSFELNDSTNGSAPKEVSLALNESDHLILGYGTLMEENNTQQVTASGLENGSRLDLNLTTLATVNLYKLSLTRNDDSATGEYSAYSADGQSWTGSVKGTKYVVQPA